MNKQWDIAVFGVAALREAELTIMVVVATPDDGNTRGISDHVLSGLPLGSKR